MRAGDVSALAFSAAKVRVPSPTVPSKKSDIVPARRPSRRILPAHLAYEFDVTPGPDHEGFTFRWGACENLDHSIPIPTPSYGYAMVKYCLAGSGTLVAGEDEWLIQPGMLFWSTAFHPTMLTCTKGERMVNYAMIIGGRQGLSAVAQYFHAPVDAVQIVDREPIESIIRQIMDEGRGTSEHREEICAMLAGVLLRRVDAQAVSRTQSHALARRTFKRCREYIEINFAKLGGLGEVAAACDVTVPYLCRLFDQFFQCSPYEYMTRLKMTRAEKLLLQPVGPIREVASALGYSNTRLFARNFKTVFGKNPAEYRQSHGLPGKS